MSKIHKNNSTDIAQLLITHKKNIVAEHTLNVLEQFEKMRFNIQFNRRQQYIKRCRTGQKITKCIKRCKTDQNKK